MDKNARHLDLRDYAERLLEQKSFYSHQERGSLISKLRVINRRLKKIESSLAPLLARQGGFCQEDTEIARLRRRIRNRLKVLPMEPILSDVTSVAVKCAKLRLPLIEF